MTAHNLPPRTFKTETAHNVPAAPYVTYLTPDSGDASTVNFAGNVQQHSAFPPALTYRVFKNFYLCQRCPLEWEETAVCAGPSYCPCCDEPVEAYDSIDIMEDA